MVFEGFSSAFCLFSTAQLPTPIRERVMILVQGEDHLDLFCIPWNGGKHSTAALAVMSVLSEAGVEALGWGRNWGYSM